MNECRRVYLGGSLPPVLADGQDPRREAREADSMNECHYFDSRFDRPQSTKHRPAKADLPSSIRHSKDSRLLSVTSIDH